MVCGAISSPGIGQLLAPNARQSTCHVSPFVVREHVSHFFHHQREPPASPRSSVTLLIVPQAETDHVLAIRPAESEDDAAIWSMLEPVVRAGETYALPRGITRADALAYWCADQHETFVAEQDGIVVGTYYMRSNQAGGGSHVANCGYVTACAAQGKGVARIMLEHSLSHAKARGFRAMQFNFVVSVNERAVKTWLAYGFEVVGRLPSAFEHPRLGFVDALVMYRPL